MIIKGLITKRLEISASKDMWESAQLVKLLHSRVLDLNYEARTFFRAVRVFGTSLFEASASSTMLTLFIAGCRDNAPSDRRIL